MGITKTEAFTDFQNELAMLAKALGHPARIAIIEHLLEINSCICGNLVDVLPLSQSTVSQHLKELKNAGLIQGNIEGTSVCYCINEAGFAKITHFFNHINTHMNLKSNDCC
jgi:ArsR family transcriptional regulator, arsenate/arsenite/antimonite-responsive transcriptional repressor